jgi:hypothetical protein
MAGGLTSPRESAVSTWRKLLVVLPAFVIPHLIAAAVLPFLDGFRAIVEPDQLQLAFLLGAFPAGYAMGAAAGMAARPGAARAALTTALLLSAAACYLFAAHVVGYAGASWVLLAGGFAAGLPLRAAQRALDLAESAAGGMMMAAIAGTAWLLSVPFARALDAGLPIGDAPGWTGPYYAQAILCVLWLPLVSLMAIERRRR